MTETGPVIIESELTTADWAAWLAAWGEHTRARIGSVRVAAATLLPLLAGLALMAILSAAWQPLSLLPFVIGAGSWALGIRLVQRLFQRASQPAADAWFLGRVRMELSTEGIRTLRPHADSVTRWSAVREVTRTSSHLFLWLDSISAFILPLRDVPAGMDASALAERVREWAGLAAVPIAAPAGAALAAPDETPLAGGSPIGFVRALGRRLVLRAVPDDGAGSSDGVIACCAAAALAVWLAFDRHAAGPGPGWDPSAAAGLSWYALGVFGLVWVVHRATWRTARYRSLLAAVVGALPLALVLGLSIREWGPASSQPLGYVLLAVILVLHLHRTLVVTTGRPRVVALAVAASAVLLFGWGTSTIWIDPHLWYAPEEDADQADDDDSAETERLVFEQSDRIDAAAARLAAGRPGRPDVFFLGFAGVGEQRVFAEELKLSEDVVAHRYGSKGRSLLLVNDRRDREAWPFATVHGLKRALVRMGEHMGDEDVLFLMLTSHGDDTPSLSVSNGSWPLSALDGDALREALDGSGIRWRVIVISACHSGAFIDALADESTIVVTSAAADRTSFGCSDDNDVTDFGAAFMRDALPAAKSLAGAFEAARHTIEERERAAGLQASNPQARFGSAIEPYWAAIEARHH